MNDKPRYRVLAEHGFFGPDDTLYTVDANGDPEIIEYEGIPNEELEPLNELAKLRMTEYLNNLERLHKETCLRLNQPYMERPRTLDGAIQFATAVERDKIAIMSAPKDNVAIRRIVDSPIPETGSIRRGRGRPVGSVKKSLAAEVNS